MAFPYSIHPPIMRLFVQPLRQRKRLSSSRHVLQVPLVQGPTISRPGFPQLGAVQASETEPSMTRKGIAMPPRTIDKTGVYLQGEIHTS